MTRSLTGRHLLCLLLFLLFQGCASGPDVQEAEIYHRWGLEAERANDYVLARDLYEKALLRARAADVSKSSISMTTYNLGRVNGYLCDYLKAEMLLLSSLKSEEEISPGTEAVSMRLFELARLYSAKKEYVRSASYYERGVNIAEKRDVSKRLPHAFAETLDHYAAVLDRIDDRDRANAVRARAAEIRNGSVRRRYDVLNVRPYEPCEATTGGMEREKST